MKVREKQDALIWLLQVSGRGKWNIFWLILTQTALGISTVVFAWFLRGAIDGAEAGERQSFLWYIGLLIYTRGQQPVIC